MTLPQLEEHPESVDEDVPLAPLPSRSRSGGRRAPGYVTSSAPRAMSSSAAKRRSVLALGSIQHLQHFYAKQGKAPPSAAPHPLAKPLPAIGRTGPPALNLEIAEEDEEEDDLPPTPLPPSRLEVKPYEEVEKEDHPSIDEAWREVDDLCRRWGLVERVSMHRTPSMTPSLSNEGPMSSDSLSAGRSPSPIPPALGDAKPEQGLVLDLLSATTAAIRIVQRYITALPPDPAQATTEQMTNSLSSLSVADSPLTVRHQSQMGVSTAARPRTSAATTALRNNLPTPAKIAREDPLSALRRASLEVLTVLRDMEVRFRLPTETNGTSPASELAVLEDDPSEALDGTDHSGHLYRENVTLEELRPETTAVREWVETADRVLTNAAASDTRIPRSPTRTASNGRGSPLAFDRALPEWASPSRYSDEPLARAHALLSAFLPAPLDDRLLHPDDRAAFLDCLADGQLLCVAYNGALRASTRPWGFVPPSNIHDISSSTASATIGRTFRRFENLRVLAAALKLRYGLSLGEPGLRDKARSAPPLAAASARRSFDARTVARRDEGWQDQLEALILAWTEAVVQEAMDC